MRIAMFSSSMPEPHYKPGGVDIFVDRISRALLERGHEVCVHSFAPAAPDVPYATVLMRPREWAYSRLARITRVPLVLNRHDFGDADVIHLHGDDWFFVRRDRPTVRTFYGSAIHEARNAARLRRKASQYTVFGLEVLASRLATESYGLIPGDGPHYRLSGWLPFGVDPVPEPHSSDRSTNPSILFVGTLGGRKRGELLLRQFESHIRPAVPDAELWMVSDEPRASPGVVHFPRLADHELASLYRSAWLLCLPSSYEGLGIPYLEAMAAGTPAVATPNPGADFLLEGGRSGAITAPDELGATLVQLLQDDPARRHLGEKGLERAKAFTWDQAAARHERAYEDALAGYNAA